MKAYQNLPVRLKKELFFKAALMYLLFFFIPIALLYTSFRIYTEQFYKENERQIRNVQLQHVEDTKSMLDEHMQWAKNISRTLLHNENSYYISSTDLELKNIPNQYIDNLTTQLRNLWLDNNFINDIVICFQDKDINITHTGLKTNLEIYDNYIRQNKDGLIYQEWKKQLGWFSRGRLLCLGDGSFYFIRSYPSIPTDKSSNSNVLIKMDNSILSTLMINTDASLGEFIAIIDEKTGDNVLGEYQNKELNLDPSVFNDLTGNFKRNGYLYSYAKSNQIDVYYISAIDLSVLNSQKDKKNEIGAIILVLINIIGMAISYHSIRRTFNPIGQLFALAKGEEVSKSSPFDPYSEIKSMLLDAAEKELAYNNINKQRNIHSMKEMFITTLYSEKCTENQIEFWIKRLVIDVDNKFSCMIKLKCTDISSYFDLNEHFESENAPIYFCENIILKILTQNFNAISFPDGRDLLFLVLLDEKKVDFFNSCIKENMEQAQRFLREGYGMETIVAVSDFHSGLLGIHSCLQEATKAMEYIELVGNKSFTRYNLIPTFEYSNEYNLGMVEEENYLLNYIRAGEFNKAKKHFNKIIKYYFSETPHAPQVWRFRLYGLINNILGTINYVNVPDMNKLIDTVNEHSSLLNCNNAVKFQNQINLLFDELEDFCIKSVRDSEDQFKNQIIDIVQHNYMNPDLSVSMIADMLNKNLDYVLRTFKKLTNTGLLDYIHEFRINKAKGYFKEDEMLSVQQVASMVGYVSCESFIRAFKRKEGVTPGRYKAMIEIDKCN